MRRDATGGVTDLLHDAGLALGESDVTTRLVLDELDLNLSPLATWLVVVVVIVVGGGARSLCRSLSAVAVADRVIVGGRRRVLVVLCDFAGHDGDWWSMGMTIRAPCLTLLFSAAWGFPFGGGRVHASERRKAYRGRRVVTTGGRLCAVIRRISQSSQREMVKALF